MKVGIIGAGRIGKVHAKNISMYIPEMEITMVSDPFLNDETEAYMRACGVQKFSKSARDIFDDPEIEAVLICSSTHHGLPVRQQGTSSGTGEIHGIG